MAFPRQEYCCGLPFLSPGDLLDSGVKHTAPAASPSLQADSLHSNHRESPAYTFISSLLDFLPSQVTRAHLVEFPVLYSYVLISYLFYIYVSTPISEFPPPP